MSVHHTLEITTFAALTVDFVLGVLIGLEIVYNGQLTNETFNGLINRNANLSRILNILKRGGVHFDLQGRKLIVTP